MTDISTLWDVAQLRADWSLVGASLDNAGDLETAVLISVFTDRVAAADDNIPDGSEDPRGWWGDAGETRPIGSRLWLLARSKRTAETLKRARDYVAEAIQWLVDDKVVSTIDVSAEWATQPGTNAGLLACRVVLARVGGGKIELKFSYVWQAVN